MLLKWYGRFLPSLSQHLNQQLFLTDCNDLQTPSSSPVIQLNKPSGSLVPLSCPQTTAWALCLWSSIYFHVYILALCSCFSLISTFSALTRLLCNFPCLNQWVLSSPLLPLSSHVSISSLNHFTVKDLFWLEKKGVKNSQLFLINLISALYASTLHINCFLLLAMRFTACFWVFFFRDLNALMCGPHYPVSRGHFLEVLIIF